MNMEIVMLCCNILAEVIFGIIIFALVWKLNNSKVEMLKTFLEITEQQILKYSAKTERFLAFLHMEENNDEMELDEEN